MRNPTYHFWITNISKTDVILGDLGLRVPAGSHMNLLDGKYHSYTPEQLLDSARSGSLYSRRNKIAIRRVPPPTEKKTLQEDPTVWDPSMLIRRPLRSSVEVEEVYYEELEISDEAYANEAADLTDEEYVPKK